MGQSRSHDIKYKHYVKNKSRLSALKYFIIEHIFILLGRPHGFFKTIGISTKPKDESKTQTNEKHLSILKERMIRKINILCDYSRISLFQIR
jgi:hypothetical protein